MTRVERKHTASEGCERQHGPPFHRRLLVASTTPNLPKTVQRSMQNGENVAVGWGPPAGREATTPFPQGRSRGPRGETKTPLRRLGAHRHRRRCVGSMTRPVASGEPRDYDLWEWIRPTRANTSDAEGRKPESRGPEYPRGGICHRVGHLRDAHRVGNPTASAVGRGQRCNHTHYCRVRIIAESAPQFMNYSLIPVFG